MTAQMRIMELYLISGALFSSDSSLWSTDTRLAPTKSFSAAAGIQKNSLCYHDKQDNIFWFCATEQKLTSGTQ